jgi:hypothetical protein
MTFHFFSRPFRITGPEKSQQSAVVGKGVFTDILV